jgi:uncharacterized short protein YbdD (DUF466 family)
MKKLIQTVNRFIREASGEAGYERYCRHLRVHHPGRRIPNEKEFYLSRLEEKYSRPSRCC